MIIKWKSQAAIWTGLKMKSCSSRSITLYEMQRKFLQDQPFHFLENKLCHPFKFRNEKQDQLFTPLKIDDIFPWPEKICAKIKTLGMITAHGKKKNKSSKAFHKFPRLFIEYIGITSEARKHAWGQTHPPNSKYVCDIIVQFWWKNKLQSMFLKKF